MQQPPLKTFGEIAAEADFRPEFFVPSTSWSRVRNHEHPVVIGRKGTGKTALRLALRNEARLDPLQFASDLAFRDYPWNVHNAIYDETVGGRSRYLETWLFLMLIELSKLVAGENQSDWGGHEAREHRDSLRLFIEENWGTVTFDHRDIFRAESYQVTSTLQPQVEGSGVGSVNWTRTSRKRLGDSLGAMNRWLKHTLVRCLQPDATYFLIFDELDLAF